MNSVKNCSFAQNLKIASATFVFQIQFIIESDVLVSADSLQFKFEVDMSDCTRFVILRRIHTLTNSDRQIDIIGEVVVR